MRRPYLNSVDSDNLNRDLFEETLEEATKILTNQTLKMLTDKGVTQISIEVLDSKIGELDLKRTGNELAVHGSVKISEILVDYLIINAFDINNFEGKEFNEKIILNPLEIIDKLDNKKTAIALSKVMAYMSLEKDLVHRLGAICVDVNKLGDFGGNVALEEKGLSYRSSIVDADIIDTTSRLLAVEDFILLDKTDPTVEEYHIKKATKMVEAYIDKDKYEGEILAISSFIFKSTNKAAGKHLEKMDPKSVITNMLKDFNNRLGNVNMSSEELREKANESEGFLAHAKEILENNFKNCIGCGAEENCLMKRYAEENLIEAH